MVTPSLDDKVYPTAKIGVVLDLLGQEGIAAARALAATGLSKDAIASPQTRVSLNQIIDCWHQADRLARDPQFAYHAGRRFHVSAFGMYGFAILSSTDYRRTMRFAETYHQLTAPLEQIAFKEENGHGIWQIAPLAVPRIGVRLYKFIVELGFGICVALHRDVMGSEFAPKALHVTYDPPHDAAKYPEIFGCRVLFNQVANQLLFDAAWLDRVPELGNEISYWTIVSLCDGMMEELKLQIGVKGRVRQILLTNLLRTNNIEAIASHLGMSTRTLRRKLHEENTSFRKVVNELRMEMAFKYLRDTRLSVEDIGYALGFSDAANFRHAFRRWTGATPDRFRRVPDAA